MGGMEVRRGGALLSKPGWIRKRERLILAYLLVTGKPAAREVLLETFWPDREPGAAGTSLNVAWYNPKRALEPGLPEGLASSYLVVERGRYGLRRDALAIDVATFEDLLARAKRSPTLEDRVAHLEEARALYVGDLLSDDTNEPWTEVERERHRLSYLEALDTLAEARVQQEWAEEAIEVLRSVLRLEPWREETYRRLMRALSAVGRRSEALHLYRRCEALLRRDLDVAPSAETNALFEAIVAGRPI